MEVKGDCSTEKPETVTVMGVRGAELSVVSRVSGVSMVGVQLDARRQRAVRNVDFFIILKI